MQTSGKQGGRLGRGSVGLRSTSTTTVESLEGRTLLTANITGFAENTYANGLKQPTAMVFAPDGRIFANEQGGTIRVIDTNGSIRATPFASVPTTSTGERGLLGIELDPDFNANGYVYVYWTAATPTTHNIVSRFTADPTNKNVAKANSRVDLINLPALGSATGHNSGSLHFGPDGKLYVSVGENSQPIRAQDANDPFGKMLRINKDGSIPNDNPFYNTNTGLGKAVWALGLRNPFTFSFQPGTGRMFINDVGQDTWEEVDEGIKGANYGWPTTEGPTSNPQFKGPVYSYKQGDAGAAIAGSTFYNPASGASKAFPSQFVGKYFYGDGQGRYVNFISTNNPTSATRFATDVSYVVDIDVAADGSLFILSRGGGYSGADIPGRVIRYTYTGTGAPSIGTQPASMTVAQGDAATFAVSASGQNLTYQWQRDGVNIPGATHATYTVNAAQAADNGAKFRVVVSNSAGSVTSSEARLTVSTVAAPEPHITLPATGTHFTAGEPIHFAGSAGDGAGGQLGASHLTWTVTYFTNGLERPGMPATTGIIEGSYTPDTTTPYLQTDVFFRIRLDATNGGVTRSTYVDVLPRTAKVTLASNIPGVSLTLDGVPVATPYTVDAVAGLHRPLGAPLTQTVNGVTYEFESWSDGGAATHDATTPTTDVTYTANYKVSTQQSATLRATEDGYVRDGASAGVNYGSTADLQVKNDGAGWNRHSYLKFDLTNLGATISSAKLRLAGKLDNTQTSGVAVNVFAAASTWTEAGLTWNTKPAATGNALASFTVTGQSTKSYEVDVTAYLQQLKAAGATSATLVLTAPVAAKTTALFSSDEAANGRPELVVLSTGVGGGPVGPGPGPDPGPGPAILHDEVDAYVRDGSSANQNFGSASELVVRKGASSGNTRDTYLRFNLDAFTGAGAASAILRLFGASSSATQGVSVSVFWSADVTWGESAVTWNTRPGPSNTAIATKTVAGTTGQFYEFDVTSIVNRKKAEGAHSLTLVLRSTVATDAQATFSSDEAATAAQRPELVITAPAQVPPTTA